MNYIKMIKDLPLWNAGYCQLWYFSRENACDKAVTLVKNVDKSDENTNELYKQLLAEHDSNTEINDKVDGFLVFKVRVPQIIVDYFHHKMLTVQECVESTNNSMKEYYYCNDFEDIFNDEIRNNENTNWDNVIYNISKARLDNLQVRFEIRKELLTKGEWGLRYTTLWIAGWKQDTNNLDKFFDLLTDTSEQREIIELVEVMKMMFDEQCLHKEDGEK